MYPNMSMLDIKRTTIADYEVMTQAYKLRNVDEELRIHVLAWQIVQAGASDKKGKPIYSNFKRFYDYDKKIKEIERDDVKQDSKTLSLFNMVKNVNKR